MAFTKRIDAEKCALAVFLYSEKKYTMQDIASRLDVSKSSVWRIVKGRQNKNNVRKVQKKRGRPEKLNAREKRSLERAITRLRKVNPNFTVMDIVKDSGIELGVAHYQTFLRAVRKLGYSFRASRKKGILYEKDLLERLKFAKLMLAANDHYWTRNIAFYLDGVSFIYKTNPASDALKPASKIWRKRSEGLVMTTKGSKDLAGGKRLHLLVAIAYGKGVILAEPYEKMNADFFSDFIRRIFPTLFEIAGAEEREEKLFLMDNDPSQTSAKAKAAWSELGYTMQKIPPRSPDLNPIENLFHLVRKRLRQEAIDKNITYQSWDVFKQRVLYHVWSTSSEIIDKTIASMPKRLHEIVKTKGQRTKY